MQVYSRVYAQWPIVFVLVSTALAILYYFAPDAEQEWVWITPGSVLATRVGELSSARFAELGIQADSSGGSNLDLGALPAPIAEIVRFAYGDATGRIFLISAVLAVVALVAVVFIHEIALSTDTGDEREAAERAAAQPAVEHQAGAPVVAEGVPMR